MTFATDIEAGRAYIVLYVRSGAFKDDIQALSQKMAKASRKLRSSAMAMGTAAVLMATPFIAGAKVYANFSKQMAFVATMLDEPLRHMHDFTRGIRKMSVEFGESTQTLSKGLYDILSAGFAPAQAMEMLAVTTKAAKAGMTDAASATAAIIAVLNAYGLGAEHAAYVSDVLFMTVKKGVLTFGELAGHIGLVASTAAQAGVSIEDMGAVLAVITRGGVETSHAVVALNNVLKSFLMPTGQGMEFAKKLKEAGLNFEMTTAALKRIGLVNVFKQIMGLPTEALAQLFPTIRAARGIFAMKAGWQGLLKIVENFRDVGGATDEAMKKIMGSFGYLMDQIKQAGVLILSYIGEALAESMESTFKSILLVASGFGEWIKQNRELISLTAKFTIALGALALTALVVAKTLALLAVITAVLAGPTGWAGLTVGIIAGIAALAVFGGLVAKIKSELEEMSTLGKESGGFTGTSGEGLSRLAREYNNLLRLSKEESAARQEILRIESAMTKPMAVGEKIKRMSIEDARIRIKQLKAMSGALEKILRDEKSGLNAVKSRLKLEEKTANAMRKQLDAVRAINSIGTRGFFLGYIHTPVLAWSSMAGRGAEGNQLEELKKVVANTGDGGTLDKAIRGQPVTQ